MSVNQETVENKELSTNTQNFAMDKFHGKAHFWGRLTLWAAIILTLSLPVYLSFVLGYHPGWTIILAGFVAYAGIVAVVWVLEPIMYFPVLGVSGTYISFLTGNIGNMCLPSAAAAQNAIGAEPGTKKGEITATLGIGAASLVNKVFLIPIILGGSVLISAIPENIQQIFPLVLPAIFGGVLAQFAIKKPIYGVIALLIGLIINMTALVVYLKMLLCIVLTIGICLLLEKRNDAKQSV
ncbi:small-conductance mechanosensitive channel [Halobacillus shinanisalinarum]|uniref:Small-conductance mechanosensitive channel n=1 Tax=Halobacillus shinanisalinarum TaxID=2932258 RepID=A0ABY4H3F1_9BACI|nr:small-conductance mechanosensitive channel [Halobacillus shinanisalinarum]UOQ94650.1 small-conductance mechanosensitive channel [Halobacillus shinanisalinarum]